LENDPDQVLGLSFLNNASREPEEVKPEPVRKRARRPAPRNTTPNHESITYPALPADATPDNLIKDREIARVDNTRDEFLSSNRDIASLCKSRQETIARARLIAGKYGVAVRKPCSYCSTKKKSCRIFHPSLYAEPFAAVTKHWFGGQTTRGRCACCIVGNKSQCDFE
jgi:hypothetical protein